MTAIWVLAIALAAAAATMLGGALALSLRGRLHLVLGFSAGAVIGVAFFDLLPEALSLTTAPAPGIVAVAALGFFAYLLFDRLVAGHNGAIDRGPLRAASLSAHSLLDGFGIGVAFQAGHGVGLVVAAAVLAHDFADGLNTVTVVTRVGGSRANAMRWLVVDAAAPVLGAAISLLFTLPPHLLALMLAGFAGFFLYIGACDLVPESQRMGARGWTSVTTVLGAACLYVVTRLAM